MNDVVHAINHFISCSYAEWEYIVKIKHERCAYTIKLSEHPVAK